MLEKRVPFLIAAVGLLVLAFIDPWDLFSIKKFVTIMVLIVTVQLIGYISTRIFSESVGLPLCCLCVFNNDIIDGSHGSWLVDILKLIKMIKAFGDEGFIV